LISVRRAITYDLQKDWRKAISYYRDSVKIEEKFYGPEHFLHFSWNLALAQALAHLDEGQDEAAAIVDALIGRWKDNSDIAADYAELMLLRCDLHARKKDFTAARTLAAETLQHPGLVATTERTNALKRHAERP
jgi:hypothetical protein